MIRKNAGAYDLESHLKNKELFDRISLFAAGVFFGLTLAVLLWSEIL